VTKSRKLVMRRVSDIEMRPIRWLWRDRIALGKLCLLAGQPGLGKSQLTCALAALVSTGSPFPDGFQAPVGSVVLLTCEDDPEDTIRPRLEAAGADTSKVHIIDVVTDVVGSEVFARGVDLSRDVELLRTAVTRIGDVRLVVIDPISAFVGKVDAHKNHEVRGLLGPLASLAADRGPTIMMLAHLNKGNVDRNAMSRVNGSGAFVAAARSAWLVEKDPDDESGRRRLMVPLKNNVGDDKTGFAYVLETVHLTSTIETSRVRFDGVAQMEAAELLSRQVTSPGQLTQADESAEFLREFLAAGPQLSKDVARAAQAEGHSPKSIRRARERLGIFTRRSGAGKSHATTWELPDLATTPDSTPAHSRPHFDGAGVGNEGTSDVLFTGHEALEL
jgi:putative DNA primase/helicase